MLPKYLLFVYPKNCLHNINKTSCAFTNYGISY